MTPLDAPEPPALARAMLDRAAAERSDERLLDRLRADPATRVLAVHGDRAPLTAAGTLQFCAPAEVRADAHWAFLGRADDGVALVVAASGPEDAPPADAAQWAGLRAVGGELSPLQAAVFVEALALGRWLVDAPFCPACGAALVVRSAGWSRRCPQCGREHFPRTDPAVIVAVSSPGGDRLLLGRNSLWGSRPLYSTFAGFVEAGESLEGAIVREIAEEAGVAVQDIRYRGSQAWPYPRSLMLGFHAAAVDESAARPDGDEIVDLRWFTREELAAVLRGGSDVELPGTASIAHRLILDWIEERA